MADNDKKRKTKKTGKTRRRSTALTKARKTQRKVIVLGSQKCGKTALVERFVNEKFTGEYKPTVEDLHVRSFKHQARHYTLQITDLASPFQFPAMRDLHIQGAQLILLLYQIGDDKSYQEARQVYDIVRAQRTDDVPVILIGTKKDLIPVSDLDADEFIQTLHRDDIAATGHVLTSAKTGEGIQEAFEMGLDAVHAKKRGAQQGDNDDAKSDTSSIGSDENCVIL